MSKIINISHKLIYIFSELMRNQYEIALIKAPTDKV